MSLWHYSVVYVLCGYLLRPQPHSKLYPNILLGSGYSSGSRMPFYFTTGLTLPVCVREVLLVLHRLPQRCVKRMFKGASYIKISGRNVINSEIDA